MKRSLRRLFVFVIIHLAQPLFAQPDTYRNLNPNEQGGEYERAYVALCLIVKDQNEDLREWIKYHRYIGVNKFYIFDDTSSAPAINVIQDFVAEGFVSYFSLGQMYKGKDLRFSFANSPQTYSYNCCLRWFGHKHTFMGFIDIDEFVVLRDENNVAHNDFVSVLKKYEDYGSLLLYWRLLGSSGLKNHQSSTLASYTKCEPTSDPLDRKPDRNQVYKAFLNVKFSKGSCGNHHCNTNASVVNTDFVKQPPEFVERHKFATWNVAFLHHYRIKSEEDFLMRMKRGSVHNPQHSNKKEYKMRYFQEVDNLTTGDCTYLKEIAQKCCGDGNQQTASSQAWVT